MNIFNLLLLRKAIFHIAFIVINFAGNAYGQNYCQAIDKILEKYETNLDEVVCINEIVSLQLTEIGQRVKEESGNDDFFYPCFINWMINWSASNNIEIDGNIYQLLRKSNELTRRIGINLLDEFIRRHGDVPFSIFINLLFDPEVNVDERSDLISTFYNRFTYKEVEPVLACLMGETAPLILNVASFYLVQGRHSSKDDADRVRLYLGDGNPYLSARSLCNAPYASLQENGSQILAQKDLIFQLTMDFLTTASLPPLSRMEVISCAWDLYEFIDRDPVILEALLSLLERDYFQWGERPSEHSVTTALTTLGGILEQPEYCALWHKTLNRLEQNPDLVPMVKEIRLYWDRVGCEEPLRE